MVSKPTIKGSGQDSKHLTTSKDEAVCGWDSRHDQPQLHNLDMTGMAQLARLLNTGI